MKLVRVRDAQKEGLPFSKHTFYAWHRKGIHSQIFVKMSRLFIDMDRFTELMESGRSQKAPVRKRRNHG